MTVQLWVALVAIGIVFVAGITAGWFWGYTARDRRWK